MRIVLSWVLRPSHVLHTAIVKHGGAWILAYRLWIYFEVRLIIHVMCHQLYTVCSCYVCYYLRMLVAAGAFHMYRSPLTDPSR